MTDNTSNDNTPPNRNLLTLDEFVSLAKKHVSSYVCPPLKQQILDLLTAVAAENQEYLLKTVTDDDMTQFTKTSLATGNLPMSGVRELGCILQIVSLVRKQPGICWEEGRTLAELHLKNLETVLPEYWAHRELIEACRGRPAQDAVSIQNQFTARRFMESLQAEIHRLQEENARLKAENAELKNEISKRQGSK